MDCRRCHGHGAWMFVEELAYSALIDLQGRIRLVRIPQEYRNLFG